MAQKTNIETKDIFYFQDLEKLYPGLTMAGLQYRKHSLVILFPMELDIIEIRAYNYFELNRKVKQIDEKDLVNISTLLPQLSR